MRKLILCFVMLSLSSVAMAYDAEIDGIYYKLSKRKATAEVTWKTKTSKKHKEKNCSDYSGNLIIPSSINHDGVNYTVTKIGFYAFAYCNNLTSITIPNSVKFIGNCAFACCKGLTSVTIPGSVNVINDCTFQGCINLTSVTIEEGVANIAYMAFEFCTSLTSISLPNSLEFIGSSAFYKCSSLSSIIIPKNLFVIGHDLFDDCPNLLNVYCYAEKVPGFVNEVFRKDPSDLSYIGYYLFVKSNKDIVLHVPAKSLEKYKSDSFWSKNIKEIVALTDSDPKP